MFEDDLSNPNPVKTFRYENFRNVILKTRKTQKRMSILRRETLLE
jgi:hypothetical protein